MQTNWRSYGLTQSRGSLPKGPVTLMVHIASVWVPFTSESKEAIASYPGNPEGTAAGTAGGRPQAGHVPAPPQPHEASKAIAATSSCAIWAKSPTAVSEINGSRPNRHCYDQLVKVAKRKTAEADVKLDDRGRRIEADDTDFGDNVLIVDPTERLHQLVKRARTTRSQ